MKAVPEHEGDPQCGESFANRKQDEERVSSAKF
jgi:hypothetical protein